MTSHPLSSRFVGVAMGHLALAVVCMAGWATPATNASVSVVTKIVAPIGTHPDNMRSQESGNTNGAGVTGTTAPEPRAFDALHENGTRYDLNQLISPAAQSSTFAESGTNTDQIAAHGSGPEGQSDPVLLTPTSIPLPSAPWAALTVVPLMLLARRYRRLLR